MKEAKSDGDVVDQLAEEFLARYRLGERPAVQEYIDQYPEHAAQIRDLFPALVALERVAPACDSEPVHPGMPPPAIVSGAVPELGDYRIVREIGRGGMGVVYEAEQQALGRRVALKVLLGPAAQDAKLLARFRRESRTAAQLHHTNIVPVFDVGQQGDLCYYAMQFIRGQALDEVFRELQRLRAESRPGSATEAAAPAGALAQSLWTGKFEPAVASGTVEHEPGPTAAVERVPGPAETTVAALPDHSELSSVASNYQCYCRNVARLGLQVAQALAYAHAHGIIHRDIKPANLLLDTSGVLWVSDFGLVKTQDPALTATGDLVGTLRYMAPERFRGECDALADVYALGLTLYELLVLRPAFDGKDRLHLVEQIGRQEPARLRALDPRIPRDLETILMKAIEKDPKRRYPSADAMAEDLRCYLADEPIMARRIGPLERLGRWGRRNPLVAGLSAAVVLITAIGFIGVFGQVQVAQASERKAQEHAAQAEQKEQEARNERDQIRVLNERLQRTLYAAHMNLAHRAWDEADLSRMLGLLEQHRPKAGEPDLRGFEWHYLRRLCQTEALLTLKGGSPKVAFSPDGKRLVSATTAGEGRNPSGEWKRYDPEIKVWDAQTGQELFVLNLKGIPGTAPTFVFSADGKRLAGGSGIEAKVWDAETGKEILSIKGGGRDRMVFSPDGKRLAEPSGREIKVWDTQTSHQLTTIKWPTSSINTVAFSPDAKRLAATAYHDLTVKVWDTDTGKEVMCFQGHADEPWHVAFSPDGKRLVSASGLRGGFAGEGSSGPGEVKVWNAEKGLEVLSLKEQSQGFHLFTFSPDGKRLAAAESGRIKVWDILTGQLVCILQGHTSGVSTVAFSPDSKHLASSSGDRTLRIWDLKMGREIRTLKGQRALSLVFSPDGKRLASADEFEVRLWDAQKKNEEPLSLKGMRANGPFPPGESYAVFNRDLSRVAGISSQTVKIWDARNGQEILTLKGHSTSVVCVAFSPDGTRLASGDSGQSWRDGKRGQSPSVVKVWDAQTGQELRVLKGPAVYIRSLVFSPDGKRLAGASEDQTVKVWDVQSGQELLTLAPREGPPTASLAFSPDGKRLAGLAGVWDAQTGQELLSLKVFGHSVLFSPDGKRLAGVGGPVKVFDAQTGQELLSLNQTWWNVVSMAYSPDGKHLATAQGLEVKIWDTQTGQETLSLKAQANVGGSLAFSPDGYRLGSVSLGGTVTIWDATPLPEKP